MVSKKVKLQLIAKVQNLKDFNDGYKFVYLLDKELLILIIKNETDDNVYVSSDGEKSEVLIEKQSVSCFDKNLDNYFTKKGRSIYIMSNSKNGAITLEGYYE